MYIQFQVNYVLLNFSIISGAASPHAVKKLLALSEQGKTRPKPSSTSSANSSTLQQGDAVSNSPMVDRKGNNRGNHLSTGSINPANHHSNSSTGASAVTMPVNLTAESSSVSSLSRKIPNTGNYVIRY